jgi:hypothetical protein
VLVPAFVVHGIAAVLIILVILLVLVLGVISLFRMLGRGARRVVESGERHGSNRGEP